MNKFIDEWLDIVPDQVALCDSNYNIVNSSLLEKLGLKNDFNETVLSKIKEFNFSENAKLVISEQKIGEKVFRVDVNQIKFQDQSFYYCKFLDTTELDNLNFEVQLARAQQINLARLTELAELAGGISHEISNPLTIVMAKISFLQNKLNKIDLGVDKEKIEDSLSKVIHHSNRITKIIKGLKNFSRSDVQETLIRSNFKELLDEAFILTIENIKLKGILVDIDKVDGNLNLMCHPVQIVQVFVNLLKNACDALEGTRMPSIKIYSEKSEDKIRIYFEDNGPGIPAEIQNKIFNPFFTTKPTGKGTGLGLSLSHHIIQQHDGRLFLDTERGPSCFCIELKVN